MINLKVIIGTAAVLGVLTGGVISVQTWSAKDGGETAATATVAETDAVRFQPLGTGQSARENETAAKRVLAERIAEYLGMSPDGVEELLAGGVKPRDLIAAAVIAKLSGQDLQAVLEAKTEQNTWRSVAKERGVDMREFRKELRRLFPAGKLARIFLIRHPEVALQSLAEYLGMDEKELAKLLKEKKGHPRDWLKAAVLLKASGKSLDEVLTMKTKSNTWRDVAASLGVTREDIRPEVRRLKQIFRRNIAEWRKEHGDKWLKPSAEETFSPTPRELGGWDADAEKSLEELDPFVPISRDDTM